MRRTLLFLIACASMFGAIAVGTTLFQAPSSCADRFASAFATRQPVKGAFACQDESMQRSAKEVGVASDADFAAYWTYTSFVKIGADSHVSVYTLKGPTGAVELLLYTDATGKVTGFQRVTP